MREKVLFIYNRLAGTGMIRRNLAQIMHELSAPDWEVSIHSTQKSGDAVNYIVEYGREYDRILCSGGDGTLNEVITGMVKTGIRVPIGYIPAGSTNDFATSLGIPSDMRRSTALAIHGSPHPVDIGLMRKRPFVYVAAFGLFTQTSYDTPQELKNVLGHAAYLMEGVKQVLDIPAYEIKATLGDEEIHDRFIFGMISNSRSVGGFKGITGKNASLDDGLLEVTLVKSLKSIIDLGDVLAAINDPNKKSDLLITRQVPEVIIHSRKKIAWTVDGEFGGNHYRVDVHCLKKRILMIS